jgi:hypothetical protein
MLQAKRVFVPSEPLQPSLILVIEDQGAFERCSSVVDFGILCNIIYVVISLNIFQCSISLSFQVVQ